MERTDAEAEAPILWSPDEKSRLIGKTLMLGRIVGRRSRGQQKMRWLDSIIDSMDMNLSKLREIVKDPGAWKATVHGVTKSRTRLSNCTTTTGQRRDFGYVLFVFNVYLFLVELRLSCCTRDLPCSAWASLQLWCAGSRVHGLCGLHRQVL